MTSRTKNTRYSLNQHLDRFTQLSNLSRNLKFDLYEFKKNRFKLHQEILAENLRHGRIQLQPKAIIIMGGISSGKSTLKSRLLDDEKVDTSNVIIPDADKLKLEIANRAYLDDIDRVELMTALHRESVLLRNRIIYHAISRKYNILIETMGAHSRYFKQMINNLQVSGYQVDVHYVETPEIIAQQRLTIRNKAQDRKVSHDVAIRTRRLAKKVYEKSHIPNVKYTKWCNQQSLSVVSKKQYSFDRGFSTLEKCIESPIATDFSSPKATTIEQNIDGTYYSPATGLLMPSQMLIRKIQNNEIIKRRYQGHFTITPGLIIEGSARFGGVCPDIIYKDFRVSKYNVGFINLCQLIGNNKHLSDAQKITQIKDIVRELITQPITLDENNKRYFGSDYDNPNWNNPIILDYKLNNKAIPISKFTELGFGDCRITNGLLSFGLQAAGYDACYSYKKVLTYPRWINNSLMKRMVKLFWWFFSSIRHTIKKMLGIPTEDHAVCILNLRDKRVVVDAFNPHYDGFDIKRVNNSGVNASDIRDIKQIETDISNEHIERKLESKCKHTFLETNLYPYATQREDAQKPYPKKYKPQAYKSYRNRVSNHIASSNCDIKPFKGISLQKNPRQLLQPSSQAVASPVNLASVLRRRNSI